MLAGHEITGGSISFTVTLKLHVAVLPPASVALYVTVVVPTGNTEPDAGPDTNVVGIVPPSNSTT